MSVCWNCGDEIEFRWIDDVLRPIHLSGGWCSSDSSAYSERHPQASSPVVRASSHWSLGHARCDLGIPITHPTVCPVCGAVIFFHTNGNGDCVFFDDLGPPWPKHACLRSEDGIRAASRSPDLMRLVDRISPPTHIEPPSGWPIQEFDETAVGRVTTGLVLGFKEKKKYQSYPGTVVRKPVQVMSVTLQLGSKKILRVHTPVNARLRVGDVVQVLLREEVLDGRSALYAESTSIVTPPEDDDSK